MSLTLLLSLFLFMAISEPSVADLTALGGPESRKLLFILAGQSNMAGRGGVYDNKWDHVVPTQCQPHPTILRLNAARVWEEARDPLHADIDVLKTCGVGPGMSFANWIREPARQAGWGLIGLVPCAVGGTRIQEWARGTALYRNMIERAKAALSSGGKIGAVLWYQGESDTVNQEDVYSYSARLKKLIIDLRIDLDLPHLLFIQVALASGEGPYVRAVREAQIGLKLPNVKHVDAFGLNLEIDHLHLTTPAQVQLGIMLADSYLNSGINGNGDSSFASSSKTKLKFHVFLILCYHLIILHYLELLQFVL